MDEDTMEKVQEIREVLGIPLTLTSAYRCKDHPSEAKKAKPGTHGKGVAVDIAVTSGAMAFRIIEIALQLGANGFALGDGFVHIDWRASIGVTWRY